MAGGTLPGTLVSGNRLNRRISHRATGSISMSSTIFGATPCRGLVRKGSIWADGTAFVGQCSIAPGHSFKYKFVDPDQAGMFWYHSLLKTQCGPQSNLAVITIVASIPTDQYGVSPRRRSVDMRSLSHKPHVMDSIFAAESCLR